MVDECGFSNKKGDTCVFETLQQGDVHVNVANAQRYWLRKWSCIQTVKHNFT